MSLFKSAGDLRSPLHNNVFMQIVGERLNFCFAEMRRPAYLGLCQQAFCANQKFSNKKRTSLRSPLIFCVNSGLLELYRCTSSLELCLDLLSVSLRSTFLDSLRSTLNEFLRLLKTKACDLLNSLDNSHLSIAE